MCFKTDNMQFKMASSLESLKYKASPTHIMLGIISKTRVIVW